MNRREFLKVTVGATLTTVLAPAFGASNNKRPNLLIIHTDEHNFRTLGCYRKLLSQEQAFVWGEGVAVETPNIDWIADHGATCTSFYATSPVCSPSRASFVSGQYPQNTPTAGNDIPLRDNLVTFAEVLGRGGYATGYAGKWHLDGTGKPQWAPKRKFGFSDNRYMFNRGHWKKFEDTPAGPRIAAVDKKGKPTYAVAGADEKSFATDFLAQKTIDFINANSDKPFCYMVSIPDPHGPNTVRAPYDTMYDHLKFQLPKTANKSGEGLPSWAKKDASGEKMKAKQMSLYFGMVKCIDDNVGKILKALREKGILENTIVVFTSDHGDMCFEHAKHNKQFPMEASAKIPFVIHYPAKVKAGTVIHKAMGCVDFMPTVLALMGQKAAGTEEGRDCSKLFTGAAPADWNDVTFFRQGSENVEQWFAAVTSRYKLVHSANDAPWLYDLTQDPDELVNYYDKPECRDIVEKLSKALIDYGQKYNDPRVLLPKNMKQLEQATS